MFRYKSGDVIYCNSTSSYFGLKFKIIDPIIKRDNYESYKVIVLNDHYHRVINSITEFDYFTSEDWKYDLLYNEPFKRNHLPDWF